jgi:hypothetical protein
VIAPGRRGLRAGDFALVCALIALRVAIDAFVLRTGFSHVSDDDYARTVIAQQFAYAPRLDPSGTSWLPLPFWIAGGWMRAFGRSLGEARAIALVLGALGVAAPFGAMRAVGVPRAAAALATTIAMALPWSAWLGVATVPDGWTGALIATGAIATVDGRARPWAAVALLIASLSRYEAWPACGLFAIFCGAQLVRRARERADEGGERRAADAVRREVVCAIVVLAGPGMWMAWNAHAHGSALHFIARVSAFRRAIGAADLPWTGKLLGFPRALLFETPEPVVLGALGAVALVRSAELRARWGWAAFSAIAVLVFLVAGDLGDGAPTHHPARALGSVWWIFAAMGVDSVRVAIVALRTPRLQAAAAAAVLVWLVSLPSRWASAPGLGDLERRDVQIARGLELRARGTATAVITPCQFEHFALIAAWAEPERARVLPRTGEPLTIDCPLVTWP